MSAYKELTKNTAIFGISLVGSKVVSLLLIPLYTFKLIPEVLGVVEVLATILSIILPIFTFGISLGIVKFTLSKNKSKDKVFSSIIFVWIIGQLIFIPFLVMLYSITFFREYILLFAVLYLFASLELLISQFVKGQEKVKIFAVAGVIKTLVLALSNVIFLVLLDFGGQGYLYALIVSNIVSASFLILTGVKSINVLENFDLKFTKKLIIFSLPFIPNSISWWFNNASDRLFIMGILGEYDTGIYSIASKIPIILISVTIVFNQAWQISVFKSNDNSELGKSDFVKNVHRMYSSLLISISAIVIAVSPIIAKMLFLKEYRIAQVYVPFLIIAMVMGALANFIDGLLVSQNHTKNIFIPVMIGGIVNVCLNILLLKHIGLVGASIATLFSYMTIYVFKYVISKKYLNLNLLNFKLIFQLGILIILGILQTFIFKETLNIVSILMALFLLTTSYRDINIFIKELFRR